MGVIMEEIEEAQDLIHGDYIIHYILVEDTVIILRGWHGKEDR